MSLRMPTRVNPAHPPDLQVLKRISLYHELNQSAMSKQAVRCADILSYAKRQLALASRMKKNPSEGEKLPTPRPAYKAGIAQTRPLAITVLVYPDCVVANTPISWIQSTACT